MKPSSKLNVLMHGQKVEQFLYELFLPFQMFLLHFSLISLDALYTIKRHAVTTINQI